MNDMDDLWQFVRDLTEGAGAPDRAPSKRRRETATKAKLIHQHLVRYTAKNGVGDIDG